MKIIINLIGIQAINIGVAIGEILEGQAVNHIEREKERSCRARWHSIALLSPGATKSYNRKRVKVIRVHFGRSRTQ